MRVGRHAGDRGAHERRRRADHQVHDVADMKLADRRPDRTGRKAVGAIVGKTAGESSG